MTQHMKANASAVTALIAAVLLSGAVSMGQDAPAIAPRFLFEGNQATSNGRIHKPSEGVTPTPAGGGIDVKVAGATTSYPGFSIVPAKGDSWDLSAHGNIQARIFNTGEHPVSVNMRVDNAGEWKDSPWNSESVYLNPGESKTLKVIFGYQYGYKPGYKLDPGAISQVLIFTEKSDKAKSFRIEDLQASGAAGEKPPVNPDTVVTRPAGGIMVGPGAKLDPVPKLEARDGATAAWGERGAVAMEVPAGKKGSVVVRPAVGSWDLGEYHEVKLTLRNKGGAPATPQVRIVSRSGSTETITAKAPVAAGASMDMVVSFIPSTPWVGVADPAKKHSGGKEGAGTTFESNRANGVVLTVEGGETGAKFEIVSAVGSTTPDVLPDWVGKRPPVEGDWKLTFEDNFDGDSINLESWNIYTSNYWDKRTHFSKTNAIVKNGKLVLRYEKKTGFHNDDPNDKSPVAKTDFVSGFADTYGKWTQRYGYYEARMKLPTCPGLWPAFWMMPDRGGDPDHKVNPQWKRASTSDGGMEFDIMEHLTAWGPYRFNCAFHWDGYGKEHKAVGTSNIYVPADADGYMTIGMLWLPDQVVYYANGRETGRWEHERVGNVQSYLILYMVSGGWANVPLDQTQLPADFVIDYVRVWQRADLATSEDGPKPNSGAPRSQY